MPILYDFPPVYYNSDIPSFAANFCSSEYDLLKVVKCRYHQFTTTEDKYHNSYTCMQCGLRGWFQNYKGYHQMVTWKNDNKPCVKK